MQMHKLGIRHRLRCVIIDSYSGMTNSVLYNGKESGLFDVFQSMRQGSLWGAILYLMLINPMIMAIRKLNIGAYVANIFLGIHVQADDVALVTTNPVAMKEMIDVCYKYSCQMEKQKGSTARMVG